MEKQPEKTEQKKITQRTNIKEQELKNDKAQMLELEDSLSQIELQNIKEIQKGKNGELFVKIQLLLDQGVSREFKKTQTQVNFSQANITGQQVRAICQLLPQLKYLYLNNCQHIKSIKLKSCKELQLLSMWEAKTLTDIQLEQMPALKILDLAFCKNLQSIKLVQLTKLEKLNLNFCSKLKQAIQLKNCKKIKELRLDGVDKSHQILVQLLNQQSAQLVILDLTGWKKIQFSQLKFNNCKKLSKLWLSDTEIADEDVQRLGTQTPQLEYLVLQGCKMIMNPSLKNFNKLKEINLRHTSMSYESVQELRKNHPNIYIYY